MEFHITKHVSHPSSFVEMAPETNEGGNKESRSSEQEVINFLVHTDNDAITFSSGMEIESTNEPEDKEKEL